MGNYYTEKLSGERLKKVYDLAPQQIREYLDSEIGFVLNRIAPGDKILDLGSGYGRVIPELLKKAGMVFGIDISPENITFGKRYLHGFQNCVLMEMDAASLTFPDHFFDDVLCLQNGISAFKTDPESLIRESIRVSKPGGNVFYSTYSHQIWEHRLNWFNKQADAGLLGAIDNNKTTNGIIVCNDGFTATTFTENQFMELTQKLNLNAEIVEVDDSCLFCVIRV
jgi:2-polyprenyl-6-hydroxyphenyl methylase/3-demethylubiquinone-9 3-methyltransferase